MTNYVAKTSECPDCFDKAFYSAKTDEKGRCLTCGKMLFPSGARPLTKEEKENGQYKEGR